MEMATTPNIISSGLHEGAGFAEVRAVPVFKDSYLKVVK
jgi:hypothetical protein